MLTGHAKEIRTLAFSPAGTELASGGSDGSVRVWDTTSGTEIVRWQGPQPVWSLAFVPPGKDLIFGTGDPQTMPSPGRMVRLWNWRNPLLAEAINTESPSAISSVAVRRTDGPGRGWLVISHRLALRSDLRTVLQTLSLGSMFRTLLAFSPDGSRLVQSAISPEVGIWLDGVRSPLLQLDGHEGGTRGLAMSPDGLPIAVATGS